MTFARLNQKCRPAALPIILLWIAMTLCLSGTAQAVRTEPATPSVPVTPTNRSVPAFLHEPATLQRLELSTEALVPWRQVSSSHPTLLLLSNDPLLVPVPPTLRERVSNLVQSATVEKMASRGTMRVADPLVLPEMAVDAALRSGLFERLVWILPRKAQSEAIDVQKLREQLTESGLASQEEAASFQAQEKGVAGSLRGVPVWIGSLADLGKLPGPVVVHFDQSYFQKLYQNEVTTPLMPLVYEALRDLRDRNLPVLAATFAYDNQAGRFSLDVRFLGAVLARLVEAPEELDRPVPELWQQQGKIFYMGNMFQESQGREIALAMKKAAPEKPWVNFTLFRTAQEQHLGQEALEDLALAVQGDRMYALEYESLARQAYDKQRPAAALHMLKLANSVFPADVRLVLQMAQLANEMGQPKVAEHLLKRLAALTWSKVYYPDMPKYLADFLEALQKTEAGGDETTVPGSE